MIEVKLSGKLEIVFPYEDGRRGFAYGGKEKLLLQAMAGDCTFTNPKYVQIIKSGRRPWGVEKKLSLHKLIAGERSETFVADRGYLWEALDKLRNSGLSFMIKDGRVCGSELEQPMPACLSKDGTPVEFRSDQESALRSLLVNLSSRIHELEQGIFEAPTGSGKTMMTLEVIRRLGLRTLIMVDTKALAKQWKTEIKECMGLDSLIIGGGSWEDDRPYNIVIVLSQTAARDLGRWAEMTQRFGMLVHEECHVSPAAQQRTLAWNAPCRYRLGISATPFRNDGMTRAIELILGKKLAVIKRSDVLDQGGITDVLICPYMIAFPDLEVDGWTSLVTALTLSQDRNNVIADMAMKAAVTRKVLILTDRVEHAIELARLTGGNLAHGKLKAADRDRAFERMAGACITVATTNLVGKGINIPCWDALIMGTPMSATAKTLQAIGRVVRMLPGKGKAFVADLVDDHPMALSSYKKRLSTYKRAGMAVDKLKVVQ